MAKFSKKKAKKYIFTLVHGTFKKRANWINSENFYKRITDSLNGSVVCFDPFEWSGKNSHKARKRAGQDLADKLKQSPACESEIEHVVLAHSHGGNVLLHALEDEKAASVVSKAILLGVPYFHIQERKIDLFLENLTPAIGFLGLTTFIMTLGQFARTEFVDFASWFLLLSLFIFAFLLDRFESFFDSWIVRKTESIWKNLMILPNHHAHWRANEAFNSFYGYRMSKLDFSLYFSEVFKIKEPAFSLPRIFSITSSKDEAAWWLRTLTYIGDIPFVFWDRYVKLALFGCVALSFFFVIFNMSDKSQPFLGFPIPWSSFSEFIVFLLTIPALFFPTIILSFFLGLGIITVSQLLLLLTTFLRGHPFGTGWEPVYQNLLVEIKASEIIPEHLENHILRFDFDNVYCPLSPDFQPPKSWHSVLLDDPNLVRDYVALLTDQKLDLLIR